MKKIQHLAWSALNTSSLPHEKKSSSQYHIKTLFFSCNLLGFTYLNWNFASSFPPPHLTCSVNSQTGSKASKVDGYFSFLLDLCINTQIKPGSGCTYYTCPYLGWLHSQEDHQSIYFYTLFCVQKKATSQHSVLFSWFGRVHKFDTTLYFMTHSEVCEHACRIQLLLPVCTQQSKRWQQWQKKKRK